MTKLYPSLADILSGLIGLTELKIVIDVGANTGQTIEQILQLNENVTIHSFEPTPELFGMLLSKYTSNQNLKILNVALGNQEDNINFFISDYSPTNSILEPNVELYKGLGHTLSDTLSHSKKLVVKQITFDNYYKTNLNDKIIDIFKTDTQGYDFFVLQGAEQTLEHIKMIVVELQFLEFYKNSPNFSKIINYLYQHGFYLYSIYDINKVKVNQWIECNALFLNKNYFPIK